MNYSFQRILVPVDGSPQSIVAFKAALVYAKAYNAKLNAVHIAEKDVSESTVHKQLDSLSNGMEYTYLHRTGSVHKEIILASKETDTDLIVMGTHGITGFQEFWMGSNAYKVVTQATCPVLTMKEESGINSFKKIVLPIDTSFESRQKVPAAISVAKRFGSIVHVFGVSGDKDKDAEYKINSYVRQASTAIQESGIETVIDKNLGGNITDSTMNYSKEIGADLIIIMTEQELQMGSFFLGKYAQQMVNHSPIPVLSVPPRDDLMTSEARI